MADLERRIFIMCPVRKATDEEKAFLAEYVRRVEQLGHRVHYPPRDTNQEDNVGSNICLQNRNAIRWASEIHAYWNSSSEGSGFDFGMIFMAEKPLLIINKEAVLRTPEKSLQNVLLNYDDEYNLKRLDIKII